MSDINAAPSSTEPAVPVETLPPSDNAFTQGAGAVAPGESNAAAPDAGAAADALVPSASMETAPSTDAPGAVDVDGGVDAPSHLMLLDAMLAEIERKIAAGIHTFAHEVAAARDHLAKLL
ncbi:hypothetical protein DIE15_12290 [Burkholderia sp. Bp9031]|uniref:hypothetical protein n=1 Tax=Burkholderia sp. Bp9031 TaxID=2184566 RepID=UPI000F5E5CB2|nr:hypothetical protein [Burkholderia sp. Bp9031]RQZ17246.1 hypothetical protein DIE15_12290 [Burkholderia sp. Bp9031]